MPGAFWDLVAKDQASPAFLRVAGAADKAAVATERASTKIGASTAKMSAVGSKLTKTITLPFLAIAGVSAKYATDFTSAMTRVQTQAGASAADVKTLSAQVLSLSKTAQQGPTDLANALYHLKSVGMDNAKAMNALKTSSDLAAVGNASLEDTTNALAGAWKSGVKGAQNFGHAAALVNAIIGSGNMAMTDLTSALGTGVLASAKTFGVSMKSVGSALALVTDEGVPANVALTRARMSMSLMAAPSAAAEKALESFGLTGTKLANDLRKPNGFLTAAEDIKTHLKDAGLSAVQSEQVLSHAFGGGRSSSFILSLVNQTGKLGQKWDQVGHLVGQYGNAVKVQAATPQAQFHNTLANLEAAGVELGNVVLPAVQHLSHGLAGAVTGFENLSSSTKTFIAIGFGIAALSGPVLALTARIVGMGAAMARATVGMSAMFTRVAGASFLASDRINTAVRGMTAALGGAAIGAAIGSFTQHMSTGAKAAGVLASAAAGAAIGFGTGAGPWGAAIGAGAGALSSLTAAFHNTAVAAISASDAEQGFATSVKTSTNALAKVNQTQAITTLSGQKAYQVLDQLHKGGAALGVTYQDLLAAATGVPGKLDQVTAALRSGGPAGEFLAKTLTSTSQGLHDAIGAQKDYAKAQHLANVSTWGLTDRAKEQVGWFGKEGTAAGHVTVPLRNLSNSMDQAALSGKRLANAINNLDNGALTAGQSTIQFQQDLAGLKGQWNKNSDAILGNSKAALQNRSALIGLLGDAKQHVSDLQAEGKGNQVVTKTLLNMIGSIHDQASALGASKSQWKDMLATMHLTPSEIRTTLLTNAQQVETSMQNLVAYLNSINGNTYTVGVNENINVNGPNIHGHAARGTIVRGPGSGTSDTAGLWALSNGEAVIPEKATSKYRGMVDWLIAAGRGMAGGGIATRQSGGKTVYVYGGSDYPTRKAAAAARDSSLTGSLGTPFGAIGSTPSAKFHVGDVGANRILGQINHAWDVLNQKISEGLSQHAARKYEKELKHYTAVAQHQLHDLRVQIRTSDVHDIKKALGGTVADTRAAFTAMFGDLTKAGGASTKMLNALHASESQLIATQKQLASQSNTLNKMQSYRSGVRSTLAGAFDPTQYGSIQDLIGGLHGATGVNRAYGSEVGKLRREAHGNPRLLKFINTLAASGQTATLQTLAHASRSQFVNAGKAYAGYEGSLTAGSNAAEVTKFGRSIDSLTTEMKHEREHAKAMVHALGQVASAFGKAKIELDGKEVGKVVGHEIDHALGELEQLISHGQRHH